MPAWGGLLIAAAAVALVDWWAVAGNRRAVEVVAKPLTMSLLVVVAAEAGHGSVATWLVIGAALGVVGDIALLDDGELSFMIGLVAFAVGHVAYVVAALLVGFEPLWALIGLVEVGAMLAFRFATKTVPGARQRGGPPLAIAVSGYAAVIAAMVTTSWGSAAPLAAVGALAFASSDWVLGQQLFAAPPEALLRHRLAVMVPYHVGQALLIVGLARA